MKVIFKAWAIGMAIIVGLGAFCSLWQLVLVPLFEQYLVVRAFAAFVFVSLIALVFGGIYLGSRYDDPYPAHNNDGDGSEEHF